MRLYVGNLHENVDDSDLRPVFEAFGEVDFIDLHKESNGKSKGFGFVQYKSESDARAALEQLNGLEIAGKQIKVGIVDSNDGGVGKGPSCVLGIGIHTSRCRRVGRGGYRRHADECCRPRLSDAKAWSRHRNA